MMLEDLSDWNLNWRGCAVGGAPVASQVEEYVHNIYTYVGLKPDPFC